MYYSSCCNKVNILRKRMSVNKLNFCYILIICFHHRIDKLSRPACKTCQLYILLLSMRGTHLKAKLFPILWSAGLLLQPTISVWFANAK